MHLPLWANYVLIAACVFVASYFSAERIIDYLKDKSLGQRTEVMRLMRLMMIDIDERRVTQAMLLLSFGMGFLVFLVVWPNIWIGLVAGSVVTVVGFSIPKTLLQTLYEKRCTAFTNQMVDGMTLMANGIKAGLSVEISMERVKVNLGNPISQEFDRVLGQMALGQSLEDALNELGARIPRADVQMFVSAVNILRETGGNMGETFQTIVSTVRERQKIERKIEAMTAMAMAQGMIISAMPFAVLVLFAIIQPEYIRPIFTTTLGLVIFFVMIALQVIGGVMIKKLVKINV